jgi:hypothetical protein
MAGGKGPLAPSGSTPSPVQNSGLKRSRYSPFTPPGGDNCHSYLAAHLPSKFWPKGVAACSHAEWAESRALAERNASRWRKKPDVEAIEILEARQV